MDDLILFSAVVLFGSMFLPLPAPVGLALVLWALDMGVPLPLVLGLYLAQDMLSFLAIRRLLPALGRRFPVQLAALRHRIPARLHPILSPAPRSIVGGGAGLFSAALVSFYAGAALASLQRTTAVRSAVLVIGADVFKWANGLAIALGASHIMPASPFTTLAASCAGLAAIPVLRLLSHRAQRPPVAIPVRAR